MRGEAEPEGLKKIITLLIVIVVVFLGAYTLKLFFVDGPGGLFRLLPTNYSTPSTEQEGLVRYRVGTGVMEYWSDGWHTFSGTRDIGGQKVIAEPLRTEIEGRYFTKLTTYADLTQGYRLFVTGAVEHDQRGDISALLVQGTQQVGSFYILEARTGQARFVKDKGVDIAFRASDGWDALATTRLRAVRQSLLEAPLVYEGASYCGEYYTSPGGLDIVVDVKQPVTEGSACTVKG